MKRFFLVTLTILASLSLAIAAPKGKKNNPASAAMADKTEADLIQILQSDKPVAEKNAACAQLKLVGTAASVPALAALLTNEELSHPARQALESMPAAEAGKALCDAMGKTTGLLRIGIIDSVGMRREQAAVPELAKLLGDSDAATATGAAYSLGRIGTPKCAQALQKALAQATPALRPAILDTILLCAAALQADGQTAKAEEIYTGLFKSKETDAIRQAAYCSLLRCSGDRAPSMLASALQGSDPIALTAALHVVSEIPGKETTKALVTVLPKISPVVQVRVLKALMLRDDTAAIPAVIAAINSDDPAVRLAAIDTISEIGDATAVPALVERASKRGPEQDAARQALARIHNGEVRQAMFDFLAKGEVPARIEIIRAIAARRDPQAIPVLMKETEATDEQVQRSAVQALCSVADGPTVGSLVRLMSTSKSEAVRSAMEDSFAIIAERLQQTNEISEALLAAIPGAGAPGRASLLRAAGPLGGQKVLAALRAGVKDSDAAVRESAIRTMAEFAGADAAPDLLAVVREAPSDTIRILAIRGYWRCVGLAVDQPIEARLKLCRDGLAAAKSSDEKRSGLTELGKIPTLQALELVNNARQEAALKSEVELASYQIATHLVGSHRSEAKAALQQVTSGADDQNLRTNAAALLQSIEEHPDYLTTWVVSGPYRQQGKDGGALFDIAFPPEENAASASHWQAAPLGSNPALFWQTDLMNVVAGNHCVVYLKTRVYSPSEQNVALAIGSDDGIKLWLNGQVVHANNASRGFTPDEDKVSVKLKAGWNDVLAKVTQHTAGCALCIRVRAENGSMLPELRCDPEGQ